MSDEQHRVTQDELKREFTKEDEYFRKLDAERLAAVQRRTLSRKMLCRREGRPEEGCELVTVQLEGMHVERCTTCGGAWLDAHELEELHRHSEKRQPGFFQKFAEILVPKDET